jgi:hypothetical protein
VLRYFGPVPGFDFLPEDALQIFAAGSLGELVSGTIAPHGAGSERQEKWGHEREAEAHGEILNEVGAGSQFW